MIQQKQLCRLKAPQTNSAQCRLIPEPVTQLYCRGKVDPSAVEVREFFHIILNGLCVGMSAY